MMKTVKLRLVGAVMLSMLSGWARCAEPEILHLPFDEKHDFLEDSRGEFPVQAVLDNVQWALGDFGRALYFCGTNSFVELDAPVGLDGAEEFTLSIRVLWRGDAQRRYPNILSSRTWSPGGMMIFVNNGSCSFRMGRPDVRGEGWRETSAAFLSEVPQNRWTHLCVTFKRPQLITYVDGKKVGSAKWDYPTQCDDIRLGGWIGSVCHSGLMDDLRIYKRALSSKEVEDLADDAKYSATTFTVRASEPLPSVAEFSNSQCSMSIDERGRLSQLQCAGRANSLISAASHLLTVTLDNKKRLKCNRAVALDKNRLKFSFHGQDGYAELKITALENFFDIEITECTLNGVEKLTFFEVFSDVNKYCGAMANMLSDDEYGISLRAYDLPVEMSARGNVLRLQSAKALGLTGWRGGLAAAAKADLPEILREMTLHAAVPYSTNGGAFSLSSEATRGSYLFANLSLSSVDDWIALADRCGYETIHLHAWWARLGHYPINKSLFPKGEADLKAAVDKIHAADLKAGMHTLTACIHPLDDWVTPKPHPDLMAANSYTLAKDLTASADVVWVKESPVASHDVVFTYSGNGNALRVGDEIIQYTGVNRTAPYSFTGCKRGAFGTKPSPHAADKQIDYLTQRYYAFYPKPDSELAEALAARLAHIFNSCAIDNFYFDGSEGMRTRYGIDFMRHAIMKKMRDNAVIEASCYGAHNWWFHSRLGTWDHPVWGMKRFHDKHIEIARKYRKTDLMATQLGWWAPRGKSAIARGHYLEDMEYFACKNMGMDTASSIQGVNVSHSALPSYIEKQLTILGWYEKLRLANYFDDKTIERIAEPGKEFELRQQSNGQWKFTPVEYVMRRAGTGANVWRVKNAYKAQPLSLRVAALQRALPYDDSAALTLLSADSRGELKLSAAGSVVNFKASALEKSRFKGALKLRAENKSASPVGAWARASRSFAPDYLNISKAGAVGLWINGDGSGALLNVQLESPREHMHAYSEHYVKLDFKGWLYFELHFRERDSSLYSDYRWPYGGMHSVYRTPLNRKYVSAINLYLNEIPAGKSSEVIISPVKALPVKDEQIVKPSIKINDAIVTLPLTLNSGDFVEIRQNGICRHHNAAGEPRGEVPLTDLPNMIVGNNRIELRPATSGEHIPRVEITAIMRGEPFGQANPRSKIAWKRLKRSCDMPQLLERGTENQWITLARTEGKSVEIELRGAVTNPVISINNTQVAFDVALKEGERLICRDTQNWYVLNSKRDVKVRGSLKTKLPLLKAGRNQMGFKSDNTGRCWLNITKVDCDREF